MIRPRRNRSSHVVELPGGNHTVALANVPATIALSLPAMEVVFALRLESPLLKHNQWSRLTGFNLKTEFPRVDAYKIPSKFTEVRYIWKYTRRIFCQVVPSSGLLKTPLLGAAAYSSPL